MPHTIQSPIRNPYIHATTSHILASIIKTEFQLTSIADAANNTMFCFEQLKGNKCPIPLPKMIAPEFLDSNKSIDDLKKLLCSSVNTLFFHINAINSYLAQLKQQGLPLNQEMPALHSLKNNFKRTLDVFYLYLLFGSHIYAKPNTQLWRTQKKFGSDTIVEALVLENFLQKIEHNNLSIKAIYEQPSAENCQKLIDLLEYNGKKLFQYGSSYQNTNLDPALQLDCNFVVQNYKGWSFSHMLHQAAYGNPIYSMQQFKTLAPKLLRYIAQLEAHFSITESLLDTTNTAVDDLALVLKPFPIALISNNSKGMKLINTSSYEYSAEQALTLGQDIQWIATDTPENATRLQAYSNRHNLNLNVILFSDLTENIMMIHQFVASQKTRFSNDKINASLHAFKDSAIKIIKSDIPPYIKNERLKSCAQDHFHHRHYLPRLLADSLLLISSLVGVGLIIGTLRRMSGHNFFFSTEKTTREKDFLAVMKQMTP